MKVPRHYNHRDQRRSSIRIILNDKQWFSDGEPVWTQARGKAHERLGHSALEAQQLRYEAVRRLQRHGKRDPSLLKLVDRLDDCSPGKRCLNGACPECGRALQRWFVSEAKCLARRLGDQTLSMVTIVPDYGRCRFDRLDNFDVAAAWRMTWRRLEKAHVSIAFGGADFSVNSKKKGAKAYLQLHFTMFIPTRLWPSSDNELRNSFNQSGTIATPVLVKEFDGNDAGFAYALKYEFHRRENYHQKSDDRRDGRHSANSRNRPLRGEAWIQLAALLDRIGLDARLCLLGVKRVRKNGEVIMRLIT